MKYGFLIIIYFFSIFLFSCETFTNNLSRENDELSAEVNRLNDKLQESSKQLSACLSIECLVKGSVKVDNYLSFSFGGDRDVPMTVYGTFESDRDVRAIVVDSDNFELFSSGKAGLEPINSNDGKKRNGEIELTLEPNGIDYYLVIVPSGYGCGLLWLNTCRDALVDAEFYVENIY